MKGARIAVVAQSSTFRDTVAAAIDIPVGDLASLPLHVSIASPDEPDVVIVGPDCSDGEALNFAIAAASASPTTAVIIVRDEILNGLHPEAMRAGVREIVDLSSEDGHIGRAVERSLAWTEGLKRATGADPDPGASGRLITVFSSKGGTGKTFLATNLAAAIARHVDSQVALLDADLTMGDAFTYFGVEPSMGGGDLATIDSMAPADVARLGVELSARLTGFAAVPDHANVELSADTVVRMAKKLREDFAFTVVDVPGDYSDAVLGILDLADDVVLMASLDVVGIKHMARAIETLTSIGISVDKIRVALNRADSKVGIEPDDVRRILEVDVDALIPSSRLVPASLNAGRILIENEPGSSVAKSIDALAQKLVPAESSDQIASTANRRAGLFKRARGKRT